MIPNRIPSQDEVSITSWGEEMIVKVELMLRKGFFVRVRELVDEIEEKGLSHREYVEKDLDTYLSELLPIRIVNMLERKLKVTTVREALGLDEERLKGIPHLGQKARELINEVLREFR
jgi:hypothetical protein